MGLLDKLKNQGTSYSPTKNGTTPSTNTGATNLSKLHTDGNKPGYSLNGSNVSTVSKDVNDYDDGVNNSLPQPSQLDLNGQTPSKYSDNLPK